MKILFASVEVAPFTKVGGLADVVGSLPKYLEKLGAEVSVFTPLIASIDREKYNIKDVPGSELKIQFGFSECVFALKTTKLPGSNVDVYFVENKKYFSPFQEVYPPQIDTRFEQERFIAFSLAILEYAKKMDIKPDIIHANDWHTAMIPVYLKNNYKDDTFFKNTKSVFSIHNLAYQGTYFDDILQFANVYWHEVYKPEGLEHYGMLVWLKGAINYADKIVTVSPKYAEEILTYESGEGLDWALNMNKGKLIGILNGIDYSMFDPKTDKYLAKNYTSKKLTNKLECKKDILNEFDLPYSDKPLIGIVSRLVEQKGFDLFHGIANMIENIPANFVVLGTGDKKYEWLFEELSHTTSNLRAVIGYKNELANKIYAGSDMFLMPSRFEPCGLSQLIALKYGSLPIVRATGGLDDTIVGYPLDMSNGFKFWSYDSWSMLNSINYAIEAYKNKKNWNCVVKNAMEYNYSWDISAKKYLDVYTELCS